MDDTPRGRRPARQLVLAVIAGLAATLAGTYAVRQLRGLAAAPPVTEVASVYADPRPLPEFALVSQDGARFDRARLRGHYTFVLFGYTSCPDACPTTLLELASARRLLEGLAPGELPAVVLVSVDPARDTPARLAAYVSHFDPAFVGLTGTPAAIETLTRALGVFVQRGPERDGNYSVDHTAALFLIDAQARLAAVFPAPHVAKSLAADYRRIRAAAGGGA
ncbi:MAG TPA: SCO family protein [Steroidobacteraceae bacterium]|nr:SCO family protein [Steroidobacteraceae bacterium]